MKYYFLVLINTSRTITWRGFMIYETTGGVVSFCDIFMNDYIIIISDKCFAKITVFVIKNSREKWTLVIHDGKLSATSKTIYDNNACKIYAHDGDLIKIKDRKSIPGFSEFVIFFSAYIRFNLIISYYVGISNTVRGYTMKVVNRFGIILLNLYGRTI